MDRRRYYGEAIRSTRAANGRARRLSSEETQTINVLWNEGFAKAHIAREIGCTTATVTSHLSASVMTQSSSWECDFDCPPAGESYIYFVQREDGLIKIGVSQNLRPRISGISNGAGPLQLLGLQRGDEDLERELHRKFRGARKWSQFEWFDSIPEILDYIEKLEPLSW